jgi:predicted nuclease of predicted toxin-antitoxin system
MRVLLDECLPKKLKNEFPEMDIVTVPEAGWAGEKNGKLLALAEKQFDVFITADQNLRYQQTLFNKDIAVIVLVAKTNRYEDLKVLVPKIKKILKTAKVGEIHRCGNE